MRQSSRRRCTSSPNSNTSTQHSDRLTLSDIESCDVSAKNNTDFYKITKSDSENLIDQSVNINNKFLAMNIQCRDQHSICNVINSPKLAIPNSCTSRRCANCPEKGVFINVPKNSTAFDGPNIQIANDTEVESQEQQLELFFDRMHVRPSGIICRKRMNNTESYQSSCSADNTTNNVLGWQATRLTAHDRLSHMLMNPNLADIYFVFSDPDGTVHKIPAHKFVLSIGSAVFEAMFRFNDSSHDKGCANCIREVELIDVEREAFKALLTFLYTDNTQSINKDSVMSILYTAKKYAIPVLENACITFLETCLNSENAFMLLSKARLYNEDRFAEQCMEIIDEEANEALKSEDFLTIDHQTLCSVLSRNTLRVKEITLFNAIVRWAVKACRAKNLEPSSQNQRVLLGDAINLIRFPLMSPTDFAKHIAPSKLLTDSEMVNIFLFYHLGPEHPVPFPSSYRGLYAPEMVVKRFQRVESSWGYTGTPDRVKFTVDTGILILGFGLYGSNRDTCAYKVEIEILNFNNGRLLASTKSQFISNGSSSTFRVMFEEPVEIAPNATYICSAKLEGTESYYGTKGLRKIKLERPGRADINWHFQYAPGNNNGTSVEDGQIPEIIFCAKHPY